MEIRKISLVLISVLLSMNVSAQENVNILSMFKEKVQKFYNILYDKEQEEFENFYCGPGEIKNEELKNYFTELTFNVSYDSITKVIGKLKVHDEGLGFSEYAILKFGNNKELFFLFTLDDAFIGRIWLSNGEELYPKLRYEDVRVKSLLWKGMINNKDNGYIELHEHPDINSKVTIRILHTQVFKYCPIGENWWPVYENGVTFLGYIQKKDVIMYQDFPKELKDKVKMGC